MTTSQSPEAKFRKRVDWLKWLVGLVVAIFMGGFAASMWIGQFAKQEDIDAVVDAHDEEVHAPLGKRMYRAERRLIKVRIHQAVEAERTKLLDSKLELLLERTEEPASRSERRESAVREEARERDIEEQQARVAEMEAAPANPEDF